MQNPIKETLQSVLKETLDTGQGGHGPLGMKIDPITLFFYRLLIVSWLHIFSILAAPFELLAHRGPFGDRGCSRSARC